MKKTFFLGFILITTIIFLLCGYFYYLRSLNYVVEHFFEEITKGNIYEANLYFKNNARNNTIKKHYSEKQLFQNGYVDYIKDKEYIKEHFKNIEYLIEKIEYISESSAKVIIIIKKSDYYELFKQNIVEQQKDEKYNFDEELFKKINENKNNVYQETCEINMEKNKNQWYIIYDEAFKNAMFGKNG